MAVSQRIMQREDFALILNELKDINPSDIKALEETRRKEAALTETELAKLAESRAYIAQADSLYSELKKERDALSQIKKEHEDKVSAFSTQVQAENKRLSDWEAKLNAISAQQLETFSLFSQKEKALADERRQIEIDAATAQADLNKKVAQIDISLKEIEKKESLNAKEAERISAWEAKLKAKAARLAAEAQSDG